MARPVGSVIPLPPRFWTKVQKGSTCWLWQGSRTPGGYGYIWFNGRLHGAHRIAWMLTHGQLPEKPLHVLHLCDIPPCVNPQHLFLGTHADNVRDAYQKGRNGHAKLNQEAVITIRASTEPASVLARRFGVGRTRIWAIRRVVR